MSATTNVFVSPITGNVGVGTTIPQGKFDVTGTNIGSVINVEQKVTNVEFPPLGTSNIGTYSDYTDAVVSIDAGTPMTLVEYPPVGLTSATTTAGPITIAVSGAFYGNGNYIITASGVWDAVNYPPWKAFNKTIVDANDAWIGAQVTYNTSSPFAALSGGPTTVSGVSYTGSWLQIQTPLNIILKRYSFGISSIGLPAKWIIAGSTDGSVWSLLDLKDNYALFWPQNNGKFVHFDIPNNISFNYFRLIVLNQSINTGYAIINEWKLLTDIPLPTTAREYPPLPMTANTSYLNGTYGAGTYVASASSIIDPSTEPNKAFNKITLPETDHWHTHLRYNVSTGAYIGTIRTFDVLNNVYAGEWLQVYLASQIILSSYLIYPASTSTLTVQRNPTKFWILGSVDGVNWKLIDSRDSIIWAYNTPQTFTISGNLQYYSIYRIVINISGNGGQTGERAYTQIAEWKLFGTQSTYPKYRTALPATAATYSTGTYSTYANTIYNATTVDAAPPLFLTDKTLQAPWKTGANTYTSTANASPIPSVFFELPDPIRLMSYTMTAPTTSSAPSAWNLYGSNMNVVGGWLLLDARTSIVSPWTVNLSQTFTTSTSAFNFLKFDFLRNCSGSGDFISLAELRLGGDDTIPESRITVSPEGRVGINTPSAKINASSALTVSGNMTVVGNINAGNLGMFRNRIINGDMRIDQRFAGTSTVVAAASTGVYVADRWRVSNGSTTGALTVQRVRAPANPYGHVYTLLAIATTAQATMNNQDYVTLEQRIEGYNIADFGWGGAYAQPVTVSFAAYSTQAGQYTLALRNSDNTRSYVAPFTVPVANQWVQIQKTIAGETSGVWEVETALGLSVAVTLAAGSNWLTSDVGRWHESSRAPSGFGYAAATGGANFMGVANNQFYLTGVQVEKGTIMTVFEARPLGVELGLCQRYYEIGSLVLKWFFKSASTATASCQFIVIKRTSPSITFNNGFIFTVVSASLMTGGNWNNIGTITNGSTSFISNTGFVSDITSSLGSSTGIVDVIAFNSGTLQGLPILFVNAEL